MVVAGTVLVEVSETASDVLNVDVILLMVDCVAVFVMSDKSSMSKTVDIGFDVCTMVLQDFTPPGFRTTSATSFKSLLPMTHNL